MFPFIILLSIYKTYINSNEYFSSFPYLRYQFKRNAKYSFRFTKPTSKMVFGLATIKELKNAEQIYFYANSTYCEGQSISQINYLIENETLIEGTIQSKNKLTPYIISCQSKNSFSIEIKYLNKKNQFDYQCEKVMISCLIMSILFFIISALYIISIVFTNINMNALFLWIVLFMLSSSFHLFLYFLLFYKSKGNEYIDISQRSDQSSYSMILKSFPIFIGINIFVMNNLNLMYFLKNRDQNSFLIPYPYIFFRYYMPMMFFFYDKGHPQNFNSWPSWFISFLLKVLYIFSQLSIPLPMSFTRFSIHTFLFGLFVTFIYRDIFVKLSYNQIPVHFIEVIMGSFSLVTYSISFICFLLAHFIFEEYDCTNEIIFRTVLPLD